MQVCRSAKPANQLQGPKSLQKSLQNGRKRPRVKEKLQNCKILSTVINKLEDSYKKGLVNYDNIFNNFGNANTYLFAYNNVFSNFCYCKIKDALKIVNESIFFKDKNYKKYDCINVSNILNYKSIKQS